MTFAAFIQIILAALKFPDAMAAFIRLLQATPVEQHDALVQQIQAQADQMKKTGRPG